MNGWSKGTLNSTKDGITGTPTATQDCYYDATGNWDEVTTDGVSESRDHNAQNQNTSVGSTGLLYDDNGNLMQDESGKKYIYDAWNRLVRVENEDNKTLVQYEYDGLFHRVQETRDLESLLLTYSADWQILEEFTNGSLTTRYVYSPIYVDALLLRDRDVDSNGSLEERIFALQDANYNIIALTDSTGTVIDRMEYKPFGEVTILNDNVDWKHYYQGGRADETTGLISFRFRWYSPELGRWTQQDPIHFAAGDINIYRALGNDPLNGLDPSGLVPIIPILALGALGLFPSGAQAPSDPKNTGTVPSPDIAGAASLGLMGLGLGAATPPLAGVAGRAASGVGGAALSTARVVAPTLKVLILEITVAAYRLQDKILDYVRQIETALSKLPPNAQVVIGKIRGITDALFGVGGKCPKPFPTEFKSPDKHVGPTATELQRVFPGRVIEVNKRLPAKVDSGDREVDIVMDQFVIQVKSGSANKLAKQVEETQQTLLNNSKRVIGYAPDDFSPAAWVGAANKGIPIARNFEELVAIIRELSR